MEACFFGARWAKERYWFWIAFNKDKGPLQLIWNHARSFESREAYIFFPGGFGTLDEFFELATLIQTHKIESVPIILVGDGYWKTLNDFIEQELYKGGKIDKDDLKLYTITDDEEEILRIVKEAPLRKE